MQRAVFCIVLVAPLFAVVALAAKPSDKIRSCPALVSRAASLEKQAEQRYASGQYQPGTDAYKQAASLYLSCRSSSKDVQSKNYAYLAYLTDLMKSVQYAADYRSTYDRVAKAADDFVLAVDDPDAAQQAMALHEAAGKPPKRELPAANKAACMNALGQFSSAYKAWAEANNRYAKSVQDTYDSVSPNANTPIAYTGGVVYAGYEIRAIRSVINSEEPKLFDAQTTLERTGAKDVAQTTADIIQNVRMLDATNLTWSQGRYSTLLALSQGASASPFQQYPSGSSSAIQQKINADWTALAQQKDCK